MSNKLFWSISRIALLVSLEGHGRTTPVNRAIMVDVHTASSILTVALAIIHIYLNWNCIVSYVKMALN
ncbi:MAG: hypothetical protein DRJ32_07730 [Thermoprotei archaeon]|nr:MAG: hypothetical protein DRJ32_07730 [Thermoprotei archaeon]